MNLKTVIYRIIIKPLVLVCVFFPASMAGSLNKMENNIDEVHENISNKVLEWSKIIDDTLCDYLDDNNATDTLQAQTCNTEPESIDAFFQTNKYLEETENTYVRVRIGEYFQSRESHDFKLKFSVQLPLSRTKKSFKLFMEDVEINDVKNALSNDLNEDSSSANLGIHYFAPVINGLQSRYSLGFSGIHPYVRARYNALVETKNWQIDTVQLFEYATDNNFEEETNIYFDSYYNDLSFFRMQLHRKTETDIDGMNYGFIFQYYNTINKKIGLRSTMAFLGNTKYQYSKDDSINEPNDNTFGGINNYIASISWRENIWRKWFYYEIRPTVNFHRKHDYKANYSVLFMLDFYFGTCN